MGRSSTKQLGSCPKKATGHWVTSLHLFMVIVGWQPTDWGMFTALFSTFPRSKAFLRCYRGQTREMMRRSAASAALRWGMAEHGRGWPWWWQRAELPGWSEDRWHGTPLMELLQHFLAAKSMPSKSSKRWDLLKVRAPSKRPRVSNLWSEQSSCEVNRVPVRIFFGPIFLEKVAGSC